MAVVGPGWPSTVMVDFVAPPTAGQATFTAPPASLALVPAEPDPKTDTALALSTPRVCSPGASVGGRACGLAVCWIAAWTCAALNRPGLPLGRPWGTNAATAATWGAANEVPSHVTVCPMSSARVSPLPGAITSSQSP